MKLTKENLRKLVKEVISEISSFEPSGEFALERSGVAFNEKFYVGGGPVNPEFGPLGSARLFDSFSSANGMAATINSLSGEDARAVNVEDYRDLMEQ